LLERKVYPAKEAEVFYVDRGSSFHGDGLYFQSHPDKRPESNITEHGVARMSCRAWHDCATV